MKTVIRPTDIGLAIELYYSNMDLSNSDIKRLFCVTGHETVAKLKKMAREEMVRCGITPWNPRSVDTKCAYRAWGLDIKDLETRYDKLMQHREKMVSLGDV